MGVHNKTASFQKEAMRTQVVLWFLWSEICIENLSEKKRLNTQVEINLLL